MSKKTTTATEYTAEYTAETAPQQLVFNPKVEQVLRAIYFGYEGGVADALRVKVREGTALSYFKPLDYVVVGVADAKGYRFTPESNSALISLGYHPTAVLLWLTQLRYNDEPVVKVQGNDLIAIHAAVANCARDVVFHYETLKMIKRKPVVVGRPILENYRKHGKPVEFA